MKKIRKKFKEKEMISYLYSSNIKNNNKVALFPSDFGPTLTVIETGPNPRTSPDFIVSVPPAAMDIVAGILPAIFMTPG